MRIPLSGRGSGDTFGEFTLPLPDSPNIRLEFHIGLPDRLSERSDGVTFVVSVQGDEIFQSTLQPSRNGSPSTLNLSPYRGQLVNSALQPHPGQMAMPVGIRRLGRTKNHLRTRRCTNRLFFVQYNRSEVFPIRFGISDRGNTRSTPELPAQILFPFKQPDQWCLL